MNNFYKSMMIKAKKKNLPCVGNPDFSGLHNLSKSQCKLMSLQIYQLNISCWTKKNGPFLTYFWMIEFRVVLSRLLSVHWTRKASSKIKFQVEYFKPISAIISFTVQSANSSKDPHLVLKHSAIIFSLAEHGLIYVLIIRRMLTP